MVRLLTANNPMIHVVPSIGSKANAPTIRLLCTIIIYTVSIHSQIYRHAYYFTYLAVAAFEDCTAANLDRLL